jgi:hypothetical protein
MRPSKAINQDGTRYLGAVSGRGRNARGLRTFVASVAPGIESLGELVVAACSLGLDRVLDSLETRPALLISSGFVRTARSSSQHVPLP